jgi:hypothetical protein
MSESKLSYRGIPLPEMFDPRKMAEAWNQLGLFLDGIDRVLDAGQNSEEPPSTRYFVDFDGWFYRYQDQTLTFVRDSSETRRESTYRSLDDFIRDGLPREVDIAQVPEWAR